MARKQKSRKVGLIGVRKSPDFKRVEKEKRVKKTLGRPAGSRNNQPVSGNSSTKVKVNKDPRLGSKKPVDLYAQSHEFEKVIPKVKFFTPAQELSHIENDDKLSMLINKLDSGQVIDKASQNYVDEQLRRHKQLCEMLGIEDQVDDEEPASSDDDLFAAFERIDVNKLKDY